MLFRSQQRQVVLVPAIIDDEATMSIIININMWKWFNTTHTLKTIIPESCPAANKFCDRCAASIQNRSPSLRNVCTPTLLDTSQTRILLSSELEMIKSCLGWKRQEETLLECPRNVSTSQALVSLILQSFTCRSSAALATKGRVG